MKPPFYTMIQFFELYSGSFSSVSDLESYILHFYPVPAESPQGLSGIEAISRLNTTPRPLRGTLQGQGFLRKSYIFNII